MKIKNNLRSYKMQQRFPQTSIFGANVQTVLSIQNATQCPPIDIKPLAPIPWTNISFTLMSQFTYVISIVRQPSDLSVDYLISAALPPTTIVDNFEFRYDNKDDKECRLFDKKNETGIVLGGVGRDNRIQTSENNKIELPTRFIVIRVGKENKYDGYFYIDIDKNRGVTTST